MMSSIRIIAIVGLLAAVFLPMAPGASAETWVGVDVTDNTYVWVCVWTSGDPCYEEGSKKCYNDGRVNVLDIIGLEEFPRVCIA